jgi:cell division protease FtsH
MLKPPSLAESNVAQASRDPQSSSSGPKSSKSRSKGENDLVQRLGFGGADNDGRGSKTGRLPGKNPPKGQLWTWLLFGLGGLMLLAHYSRPELQAKEIPYSEFKARIAQGEIQRVVLSSTQLKGFREAQTERSPFLASPRDYYVANRVDEPDLFKLLDEKKVRYEAENEFFRTFFWYGILPVVGLLLLWRMLFARAMRMGPGAGIMSFGKNRAKLVPEDSKRVTFADVAGVDEAKEELSEIIDFLKTPQKFRAIGGKIPKGILLVGPPGTGKTLLARAVAGEAGVPFFSLSGSEFVEMFVGVGAARVRDLFAQAVEKSPCIIFIDELDAIGKMRSAASPLGGHDEREQTLNQLLVEMDGFDPRAGVILMAATNRPETLDPALLRAGRFDRQVLVDRPDVRGREAILRIHAKNVRTSASVDLKVVAQRTPGFVGADLANVVNEAALLAVRKGKEVVDLSDFDEAIDRVIAGLQKKTKLINPKEKRIVAHHEIGHALVTYFTPGTDPVHKVSIIPRGFGALGFTMALPKEDRHVMTQQELLARIDVLYGGRVAEEVVFNEISTGASDDLQKATDLARRMVTEFGMSELGGYRNYASERHSFLGPQATFQAREYSEAVAEKLDRAISDILDQSLQRVRRLLKEKEGLLRYLAGVLSEREVLEAKEFEQLVQDFELGIVRPPKSVVETSDTPLPEAPAPSTAVPSTAVVSPDGPALPS